MQSIPTVVALAEEDVRRRVCRLLNEDDGIDVVAVCSTGREAAATVRLRQPALVVLDVDLSEFGGFDVLEAMPTHKRPLVIFTADDGRHAFDAFEVNAVDYLLHPISQERLERALQKAQARMQREETQREIEERMHFLLERVERPPLPGTTNGGYLHRFAVQRGEHIMFVAVDDVAWIEADNNYVRLHAGDESYLMRSTLYQIEAALDPRQFLRIHRSHIVNVNRISKVHPLGSGDYLLVLDDDTELVLSRTHKRQRRLLLDPLSTL